MAGILDKLIWPQKSLVRQSISMAEASALELEAAKGILAEVFRIKVSEVDEMILSRFEKAPIQEAYPEENGPWPQEFRLEK
jgi:hypothetical protein